MEKATVTFTNNEGEVECTVIAEQAEDRSIEVSFNFGDEGVDMKDESKESLALKFAGDFMQLFRGLKAD